MITQNKIHGFSKGIFKFKVNSRTSLNSRTLYQPYGEGVRVSVINYLAVQFGPLGSPCGGGRDSSCVISSLSDPVDKPVPFSRI